MCKVSGKEKNEKMGKNRDYFIVIPKELLTEKNEYKFKSGVLMAYCWIRRYGSNDGYFEGRLHKIIELMNLKYSPSKKKTYPVQIQGFIQGLDYLCEKHIIDVIEGDYKKTNNSFRIKVNFDAFENPDKFILLKNRYFDYLWVISNKQNKNYILYVMLFVLSCCFTYSTNGKKQTVCACSYSLKYMQKITGINITSLRTYLNAISIEIGEDGNTPFVRSKPWYTTIKNNDPIRFSNIYVENTSNAHFIIESKKNIIMSCFKNNHEQYDYRGVNDSQLDELFSDYDESLIDLY